MIQKIFFLFLTLFSLLNASSLNNIKCKKPNFTPKEQAFMQKHKKITTCVNVKLFPIDGARNHKITGEMGDLFKIISSITSFEFVPVVSKTEKDLKKNVQEKKCEVVSVVATLGNTFPTLRKTMPFSATPFALLGRLNTSFADSAKDLEGKIILVNKKSIKKYLHALYPFLTIKSECSINKMVQDVLHNRAYAIVAFDEQADYLIDKFGFGKLKITGFLAKERPLAGSIGIQNDQPVLYSILQKSLASISKEKITTIRNSWRLSRYRTKIDYTLAVEILVGMGIVLLILIYYQQKLKNFNKKLEKEVEEKTRELREINESLEQSVQEKVQKLVEQDKLINRQSKQAVMGEMIAMIAHQWRQPLNIITLQISNLQLKGLTGEKISQEELQQTLSEISNTILYLSNTIEDFKTYFRPDKKRTEVTLNEIITKSIGFLEPRLKKHNVKITIQGDVHQKVSLFANEMIQVLLNILNNAIDAYNEKEDENKEILIRVTIEADKIDIMIQDHAGGIASENMEEIFEPYFSTKGKNGTGLGLYMSRMIIEKQFNGTLEVASEGDETTFHIAISKDAHS